MSESLLLAPITQSAGLYPAAPPRIKKPSKGSKIRTSKFKKQGGKFQKRPELPPIAYHVTPYDNPDNPPVYKRTGGRFWKVESERCSCGLYVWQHLKPRFVGGWVTTPEGNHIYISDDPDIESKIRTERLARNPKTNEPVYDYRSQADFPNATTANSALNNAAKENGYKLIWEDEFRGNWGILDAPGKTSIHFGYNNPRSLYVRSGSLKGTGDKEGLSKILSSLKKFGGVIRR